VTARATWSPAAIGDLEGIVYFIAVNDGRPATAEQIARQIDDACRRYAQSPSLGEREPRLGADCRRFVYKRWVVLYRPEKNGIEVLRVIDAARDFDRVLGSS
jgi:plasmid stabilization system protein ParE